MFCFQARLEFDVYRNELENLNNNNDSTNTNTNEIKIKYEQQKQKYENLKEDVRVNKSKQINYF